MEEKMGSAMTTKNVWILADSIVSPLGETSEQNFENVQNSISGLSLINDLSLSPTPIIAGKTTISPTKEATRLEAMCLKAIEGILKDHSLPPEKTLFILSTTKGNISSLESNHPRLSLHALSKLLCEKSGLKHSLVVSNACISGVMAITIASRFLRSGKYKHALIVGADELSQFVISGFQSLQALSNEHCKPFDSSRKGINLGEAAAAMLLSADPSALDTSGVFKILGSGLTNDSNHISGPSRTGEELAAAIHSALEESNLTPDNIDFISAHGTATPYNDEMESKAFSLEGLSETPVNSLKPFYGHTLGAAGIVETIISLHSLKQNVLIPTMGYESSGVSKPLNVIREREHKSLNTFLKTASGFGGCNAAIVIQKVS
jgi:3-oxoacyl-[acyl-carrier-protein] synthase I